MLAIVAAVLACEIGDGRWVRESERRIDVLGAK